MNQKSMESAKRKQAILELKADKIREQLQSIRGEIRQQKHVIADITKRTRQPRLAELGAMFEREGLDHIDPVILHGAMAERIEILKGELKEPGKMDFYLEEGRRRLVTSSR